ncbi:RYamide receptor-like [Oratosquilla oratoria]|uniref:RYamide receptor-like n=1 Tax=Oratosquilla oratoria TaxID=337810 RepID=UPI003F759F3E
MARTSEQLLEALRSLNASELAASHRILLQCQEETGNLSFDEPFLLGAAALRVINTACDFCENSNVTQLWENGLCQPTPHVGFDVTVYVLYCTILVVAVLGNCLVVYVVVSSAKMRTVTNYFIANLAMGDLFMAIFCVPFSFLSTLVLQYWPFGGELCVIVNYLQAVSVFVSAYTLVAISFDRYLAIIYPLRPRMTRLQAKMIITTVWVLSLLTTLPIAFFSSLWQPPTNFYRFFDRSVCMEDWGEEGEGGDMRKKMKAAYGVTLMMLQYFLPITVLVFTYSRIAIVVWGKKSLGETPAHVDRIARSKRKMIKMMVTVVFVYTFCWLPFNVLIVVRDYHPEVDNWEPIVYMWAAFHWLAMSHTCYNPLILCWMNLKFRARFATVAYYLPCCRGLLDSRVLTMEGPGGTMHAHTCMTHFSRGSSRLVTISFKDETIVFKSHRPNSGSCSHRGYSSSNKFLRMLEETSSESPL